MKTRSGRVIWFRSAALLTSALATWAPLLSAHADDDLPAPAEFQAVRAFIDEAIAQRRAPSVAVGVVRNGRLVWAEGFGFADLDAQRPATSNSIYRLASISKPITGWPSSSAAERCSPA